ncbi:two component transcriptional regulator, winged helix family [Noviherbaspirillum humi]|uniref:Two component transcriptional regulator, winged helix family n=1 Tax=Noviherbaspirillum humi TaxID=1688639 RepID=A0A239E5U9_9BURK|nr:response regulator transcription factor [Noviherbaspirillum humi]SNS40095.1 two component transcriptional regulator, winged helix family [Noviherbaspirillum humi]
MRILLAEDDPMIGEGVRTFLRQDGHAVDWVRDGAAADAALATEHFDLLLLDLGLPRRDGIEVLRALRGRGAGLLVIVLTARDAVEQRVQGLDAGADDYLVKPFDLEELAARIRSALRRSGGNAAPEIALHGVRIHPATREVSRDGKPVTLSAREYALVEALAQRPGAILSRAQLEERLYGWGEEVESNAVEVHIHGIRRKLGTDFIQNVRGVGWFIPKPGKP